MAACSRCWRKAPRLKAFLRGHRTFVSGLAFSGDGKSLAVVGDNETILLYDIPIPEGKRPPRVLRGPIVTCVGFSPNGKSLAAGSSNRMVYVWDLASPTRSPAAFPWEPEPELSADPSRSDTPFAEDADIKCVAFSRDGMTLAACGEDSEIILHDVAGQTRPRRLKGHTASVNALAFSPDGKTLASGGSDLAVILWDVASGQPRPKRGKPRNSVNAVTFSPDGKILASGGWDKAISLWKVGEDGLAIPPRHIPKQPDVINSLAFSGDGKTLASGGWDKKVTLWDVETGHRLEDLPVLHKDIISGVAFGGPTGWTLASGSWDRTVLLWDAAPGHAYGKALDLSFLAEPPGAPAPMGTGHKEQIPAPEGSPLRTATNPATWPAIKGLAFSRKGGMLALTADDGTIVLWDRVKQRRIRVLPGAPPGVDGVDFDPTGERLAVPADAGRVAIWDVSKGEAPALRLEPPDHGGGAAQRSIDRSAGTRAVAAFSPAGDLLASLGHDGVIWIYELPSGRQVRFLDHILVPNSLPESRGALVLQQAIFRCLAFDRARSGSPRGRTTAKSRSMTLPGKSRSASP